MNRHSTVGALLAATALLAAAHTSATAATPAAKPDSPLLRTIEHEATVQRRAAVALSQRRLAPRALADLDQQAAAAERRLATALVTPAATGDQTQARDDAQALDRVLRRAEHERSRAAGGDPMDAVHARVAALREAEQQSWIDHALRSGRLGSAQAAAIERAQARILSEQAALERRGHETVDEALRIQHAQDVEDWSIRTGQVPGGQQA